MQTNSDSARAVDVLIVGSGPAGAAFARVIAERAPDARILMIDAGPQLTARPGMHVKNIADPIERTQAQIRSQGPSQFEYALPSIPERAHTAGKRGHARISLLARPGTHLINPDDADLDHSDMPAAAAATNVGGAGAHWTCACPRPGNAERVPFIPIAEWDQACAKAEALLCVTTTAFPPTVEGFAIQQTLSALYDSLLPDGLQVGPMPLAVQVCADGALYWTGSDVILGPLAEQATTSDGRFELRAETLCRRLIVDGDQVTSAEIHADLKLSAAAKLRAAGAANVTLVEGDSARAPLRAHVVHASPVADSIICFEIRVPSSRMASAGP